MDKLEKIYKKMLAAKEQLEKARQKMADEYDPNEDPYEGETEYDGTDRDFDPDEESDDADKWLAENDPAAAKPADEYSEYEPDEDDEAHRAAIDEDMGSEDSQSPMESPAAQQQAAPAAREAVAQGEGKKSRWQQPSREDLMSMRQYTRPWEQRAREAQQLKADPSKNPQLVTHLMETVTLLTVSILTHLTTRMQILSNRWRWTISSKTTGSNRTLSI